MATTSLNHIYKLNTSEIGYLMKNGTAPLRGETYPIYVPRLMPGISMQTPKTSKISTKGISVFKNSPQCAIRADAVMTTANYLEIPFEGNSRWTSAQATIDPSTGSRVVKRGLQITCHNTTNAVEDMTFTNA